MVQVCMFSYEWFSRYALLENLKRNLMSKEMETLKRGDRNSLVHFEEYSIYMLCFNG